MFDKFIVPIKSSHMPAASSNWRKTRPKETPKKVRFPILLAAWVTPLLLSGCVVPPTLAQTTAGLVSISGCMVIPGCRTSSTTFSTLGINIRIPDREQVEDHIITLNARAVVNSQDNGGCQFQITKTVGKTTTVIAATAMGGGRYSAFMRIPVMLQAANTSVPITSVRYGVTWRQHPGGICTVLSNVANTGDGGALLTVLRITR